MINFLRYWILFRNVCVILNDRHERFRSSVTYDFLLFFLRLYLAPVPSPWAYGTCRYWGEKRSSPLPRKKINDLIWPYICLFLPPPKRLCFRHCLSVYLYVCLLEALRKNFRTDLHEIFREGWLWPMNKMIRSGGDPDCFPDSSLLEDTKSGINRLRCAIMTSLCHRPTWRRYALSQCF